MSRIGHDEWEAMRFTDQQLQSLSDFQSWKEDEDEPVTLLDYAGFTATPDQLFAYAAVFFRALIEVDGHYYFEDAFDADTYALWKSKLANGREIQRVMNALPMTRLLQSADVDAAGAAACARLVADAWNEVHGRKGVVAEVHGEAWNDLSVTVVNGHE
jgi:hypothetical protein